MYTIKKIALIVTIFVSPFMHGMEDHNLLNAIPGNAVAGAESSVTVQYTSRAQGSEEQAQPLDPNTLAAVQQAARQLKHDLFLAVELNKIHKLCVDNPIHITPAHVKSCLDSSVTADQFRERYNIDRETVARILAAHIRLFDAAQAGQLASVRILAPVCLLDSPHKAGRTALHEASRNGFLEIVELLIKRGANVNAEDDHGQTPLTLAHKDWHVQVIALLLRNGAKSKKAKLTGPATVEVEDAPDSEEEVKAREENQEKRAKSNQKSGAKKSSWWSWCS